jgi:hypothetical protein
MSNERLKHLEFIQSVITRLGGNSFLMKGWTVTLVAALFALAAKETQHWFAIVSLFPALCFWGLDAYYLRQERLFRRLFAASAAPGSTVPEFSMDTSAYDREEEGWFRVAGSTTIIPFYGPIVLAAIVATALTWRGAQEPSKAIQPDPVYPEVKNAKH